MRPLGAKKNWGEEWRTEGVKSGRAREKRKAQAEIDEARILKAKIISKARGRPYPYSEE